MPSLSSKVANSRSRLARVAMTAVPLASLPVAQRRLISALIEAANAAAQRRALAADTEVIAPGETLGGPGGGR